MPETNKIASTTIALLTNFFIAPLLQNMRL
jgi:hypothetical protein